MNLRNLALRVGTIAMIATLAMPPNVNLAFAAGPNIVPNSSLETASATDPSLPENWHKDRWGRNRATFTYPVPGVDGSKAARVALTQYTGGDAKWYFDHVDVTAGDTYTFKDSYKSNVPSFVIVEYVMANGTKTYERIARPTASAAWKEATGMFVVPTGVTSLTVLHLIRRVGSLTVDNYSLTKNDATPTPDPNPTPTPTSTPPIVPTPTSTDPTPTPTSTPPVTPTPTTTEPIPTPTPTSTPPVTPTPTSTEPTPTPTSTPPITPTPTTTEPIPTPTPTSTPPVTPTPTTTEPIPTPTPTSTPPVTPTPTSTEPTPTPTSTPPITPTPTTTEPIPTPTPTSTPPVTPTPTSTPPITPTPTSTPPVTPTPTSTPPITPTSTPPVTGGLVPNADLNIVSPSDPASPNFWRQGGWGTNQAVFSYPVPGPDGSNAAKVAMTQYTNGDAKWYFDHVSATAGETYRFTESFQSDVPSVITVEYAMADGTMSYADIATPEASAAWTQASATFVVPVNVRSMTVFHSLGQVGSLTVDNFSLVKTETLPIPPPPPAPGSANMIPNATLGFASLSSPSAPAYWHEGGWGTNETTYSYPITGHNGMTAIQTQLANYTDGDAKWFFDPVTVTGYENYEYSDYYKSDVPSIITAQFAYPDGTYTYADIGLAEASADWAQSTAKFSVPAGATALTVFHLIKQNGSLAVSDLGLKLLPSMALDQGMVTISFDDGYKSVYDLARPILDAAGYKPTLYIITGPDGLDNSPDYMSTEEVRALYNNGYEIGSHTRSHAHLTTLTADEMTSEIKGAKDDLLALGFTPASTFAYPYGEFDGTVVQAVKDAGYVGARSVNQGFNDKTTDPYLLMDQHVEKSVTADQIKGFIDHALLNRQWLILELHDQDANGDQWSNSPETLQSVVDYLKQRNAKVVTVSEGLQAISQ